MSSLLSNYSTLVDFFTDLAENDSSDAGAKASRFAKMMQKFEAF